MAVGRGRHGEAWRRRRSEDAGQGSLGAGAHAQWRRGEPRGVDADQLSGSPIQAGHASAAPVGHAAEMKRSRAKSREREKRAEHSGDWPETGYGGNDAELSRV